MALDPLKFQVAIQDEATGQLNQIEQEFNKLKDKTISVKVEGLSDLQQLLSALQHQQVSNLGKDVGNAINEASRNLQKEAQDAVRTSLGSLAQDLASIKTAIQSDNFSAFSKQIETCAEKVNLLDEAFKKFKVTIGENKELKDLLTGWGAAIKEVSAAMAAMNSVKNGGGAKAAQKEELRQQEEGLIRVANAMGRVRDAASGIGGASASGVGFMESINKVGERNIQTLIKEQGHIERLIAIAKKSIDFGEGHPVLGMGRLRGDQMQNLQNLEQLKNIIKEILFSANQGDQAAIRFLNTLGSLKTVSFGKDLMGNNITLLGGHFDQLTHSVTGTATAMRQLNKDMRLDFNKAANKEKLAAEAEAVKKLAASYKSMQQESKTMRSQSESALASRIKMLREQSADLQKLLSVGKIGLGEGQYNSVRDALREIRKELQQIETITQRGGYSTGLLRSLSVGRDYSGVIASGRAVADMRNKQAQETNTASRAVSQLTMEEQRLAQALNHATNSASGQSQVLSDLKSLATQYLSVWGAQSFVGNIIEIGGQLEKQRLSIGAILGDVAHANDLFGKVKNLAVQSPFGVVELDQYTKQLTAYGFKYNELYDMTKRLADISAGAGTDVSRLTLALGHVRSEGALTGYTLRQFAMNNIPMLSQLAKKLSEVEHRVVTASDVRKRVSKKEIGYEDVVDVIKNLTNEGGMFYNMQETISQSIQSRFKNLKDSLDIMYGEIAESKIGDALKGLAVVLTDLSRNWKSFVPIIESAAIAWGVYKAATLSVNMALGSNTAAVTSNLLADKKKRAEELQHEAMVRKLTAEEQQLVQTRNRLTASNIQVALSTGAMTKGEALKLVALRKVSLETTKALIGMGAFSAAEARMALNGRLLWMNLGKVGASLKLFGASAWSSIKNLAGSIFTPLNAAFAALTIGMSAKGRMDEFDEIRKSRRDAIREQANEGYRNLIEATKNFAVGASQNMSKTDINLTIDDMIDKLKEYSTLYNTTFNEAFKTDAQGHSVHSLAEQYEILAQSLEDAANAHKLFADMSDLVSHAIETNDPSNGFWKNVGDTLYGWMLSDDTKATIGSLSDSLERYAQTTKDVGVAENLLLRDHLALRAALDGRGLGDVMNMANDELIRTLGRLRSTMPDVFAAVRLSLSSESRAMLDDWTEKCNSMNEAYAAANLKMRRSGNDLYESMKVKFGSDMTKWPSEWREFVMMAMNAATKDVKGFADMSIEYQNLVRDSFLKPFGISVDSDEAKEKVNDLYVDLQNLVGKKWVIQVGVKGESAWDDLETSGKKYTENDKKVKQLEKNLKRLNYVPGAFFNSREAEKVAEEYNEAIAERRAAKILYESYGGDVSELDKSKKNNGRSGSKSEDKDARRLREIVKLYKDAYDWYGKYEKQVGEGSALAKVKEQFQPLFDEFRNQWKQSLSLDSIPEYKQNLETLLSEAQKLYESPKHKNSYMVEAIKTIRDAINNVDYEEAQRKMDEYASRVQIELDGLTRSWDIFNNVREATGNIELAVQLSGVTYNEGNQNLADALKDKIQRDLDKISAGLTIDLNVNLSDEDIQRKVKEAFDSMKPVQGDGESNEAYAKRLAEYQSRIKGIVEEYQKWRDLQRDVEQRDMDTFGKLIGSAVDLQTQVMKINDEYKELIASLDRLRSNGKLSDAQYGRAKGIADANTNMKLVQATAEYQLLMNGVVTMSKKAAQSIKANFTDALRKQLLAGGITAKEYADKIAEINDKMQNLEDAPNYFQSYMKGGFNGIFDTMNKRGQGYAQEGAQMQQNAQSMINESFKGNGNFQNFLKGIKEMNAGNEMAMMGEGMQQMSGQMANTVAIIDMIVHGIDNFVQGMKRTYDEIREMYDALGYNTDSDGWTDTNTFFSSFSAASASATKGWDSLKNGDVGGVIEGVVGSWTNWITGFSKGHDQKLENHINAMKHNVDALKANTDAIKSARDRTLGYDRGVLRSQLSNMYDWDMTRNGEASRAMYLFHRRNSDTSGYSAELENLKAQRKEYINMYNAEDAKKKSSQEALDDYKEKIAELDEQITFFIEDLAKELWDIDFKAWASQISDALWTAFENGEDAIEAFRDTAKDIISDVSKRMMNIHLIEPKMAELEDMLFGKMNSNGQRKGGGAYDSRTGEFNEEETLRILGQFFGEDGEFAKVVNSAEDFYKMAQSVSGIDFSADDSQNAIANTTKGITEQTADLIASYINAMRADVSVNRAMISQYFPMYYNALTSGNESLRGIENHTAAIMRSNEAIERSNQAILERIDGLRNKTWKVPIA